METDHKLTLLARAEKDGKPVHPGLKDLVVVCPHCGGDATYVDEDGNTIGICEDCDDKGYLTSPDPMALISACQGQGWSVGFSAIPGHVFIRGDSPSWNRGPEPCISGSGSDNHAALIDVLFQATKTLDPDNWGHCVNCHGLGGFKGMPSGGPIGEDPFPDEMCVDCQGTGIVIMEATNGT